MSKASKTPDVKLSPSRRWKRFVMKQPNSAGSVDAAKADRKLGGGLGEGTQGRAKRMPQGWEPPYPIVIVARRNFRMTFSPRMKALV